MQLTFQEKYDPLKLISSKKYLSPARSIHFITVFLLSLFLSSISFHAAAKNYTFDRLSIEAEVLENGDMLIEETRTYTFQGAFSWADHRLPLEGVGTVKDFELQDRSRAYKESASESPGTYKMRLNKDEFYVRWFYRAKNETRNFTLRYKVTDVITVYPDLAELYYKFIGEANQKGISKVNVTIKLPRPAVQEEVKAWAHGPLWGTILFTNGFLKMDVSPHPRNRFWEARVIFPPSWVPLSQKRSDSPMMESLLAQETEWAEQANKRRQRAEELIRQRNENYSQAKKFAWILSALAIIAVAFLYFKWGRGFQVPYSQKTDPNLPEQPPAIFSALFFDKQVTGNAMVATLFDMARRGYLKIEQKEVTEKKWWRSNKPRYVIRIDHPKWDRERYEATEYEQSLLDFIFQELGKGQEIVDFRDFRKHSRKVLRWFRKWRNLIKEEIKDVVLYDRESIKALVISEILSLAVAVSGIFILIFLGTPGIAAIITGGACLFLSLLILRYTPEMKLKKKKWKALKNYLTKYHFADRSDQGWLEQIQDYLIYAVAMGAGVKPMQKLMEMVPSEKQQVYFPWYLAAAGSHATPADFASAVTSMVSTATTTVSSSAGVGGGASVGGGGGAGGASGGAG